MSSAKVDMKIVLLGSSYTGKSCLVNRFINETFEEKIQETVGAAFSAKTIEIGNDEQMILGVWDTAGQERFESMSKMYYRKSNAAILCYDVTQKESFDKLKFWAKQLKENEPSCRIYITATKIDLLDLGQKRAVALETIEEYAEIINARIFETSAKQNLNVNELFLKIATDFKEEKNGNEIKNPEEINEKKGKKLKLNLNDEEKRKTGCCK
ncbi:ras-related protein rab-24 [Anaeramoeba flamelloides]|uniref:Ras-related protein rab-24 n=1 Tax=Anaeramoeba flamelloides TaxID=1746091 RepID=A0AAV8A567_9EUKA|nr:ras-related protein rab-24 [Anaeramoeba flamelloides]